MPEQPSIRGEINAAPRGRWPETRG